MGGNIAIYIFPSTLIHSIVGETILYVGPNPTYEVECANESIQHQCKQEESRAGTLYQHNIKAFVPGNNDDTRQTLALLSQYPTLIVVLQNGNGEYCCIGNKMEGLRLLSDFDSSADPSGHNGFTIELSGKLTILPKPVQMPIIPI
ncbi:MAG: hypothetical protein ACOYN4_12275 [Bacteroidales bacterium]